MRIATVRAAGAERAVAADADVYRRLDASGGLADLLRAGVDPRHLRLGEPVDGQLAARLRPGKVVAIGLNYLDHIRESNLEHPTRPLVFAKFPSSVIGPADRIELDETLTMRVDWEVELAVVVGTRMRRVAEHDALHHVFGYTVPTTSPRATSSFRRASGSAPRASTPSAHSGRSS
jgi:5-carboxymethyl-2-hydroxymuconate isomerase